jgi:hypothetical protein
MLAVVELRFGNGSFAGGGGGGGGGDGGGDGRGGGAGELLSMQSPPWVTT